EELPNDRAARCAEGSADADLLGAVRRAVEQEIGDVGASDQQDEEHGPEHRVEYLSRLGTELAVDEMHHRRAHAFVLLLVLRRDALGDRVEVGVRRVDRYCWL